MPSRKPPPSKRPAPYWPWLIAGGVILVFLLFVGALVRRPRPTLVLVGDHWHARLTIEICGRTLPPLPPSPGDVHTHGDGVIHIHPEGAGSAGRNATLGRFFATTPMRVTANSIASAGESRRNGDRCPDGRPGTLQALVRHRGQEVFRPERDFLRYLPQDGDEIRVVFGP
jgi:hypothetical protein